jgi:primosomal protein DnaI
MNHIATAIKHLPVGKRANMFERFQQIQNQIEQHPAVIELRKKYPKPSNGQIDPFPVADLHQYTREYENCQKCPGLDRCMNLMPGYALQPAADSPALKCEPCELKIGQMRQAELQRMVKSHHIKPHILNSTFDELVADSDTERKPSIMQAMKFCADFEKGKTTRGMYLYGGMGRGKSKIAGAMAGELARRGVDVLMVYVPDFLEEMKDSIREKTLDEKLQAFKTVSVLILDDIGAEALTKWTRDSVLGRILQERMEVLPTIYTSNLPIRALQQHMENVPDEPTSAGKIKAQRIMERIEPFVKPVEVRGRNWRREGK